MTRLTDTPRQVVVLALDAAAALHRAFGDGHLFGLARNILVDMGEEGVFDMFVSGLALGEEPGEAIEEALSLGFDAPRFEAGEWHPDDAEHYEGLLEEAESMES